MVTETIKHLCYRCQRETNHLIECCVECAYEETDTPFSKRVKETWRVLRCCGCESLKVYVVEDSPDFKNPIQKFFPIPNKSSIPPWINDLDHKFYGILKEIYQSIEIGSLRLAAIGIRTVIDMFLTEHLTDIGGFEQKLKQAVSKGILTGTYRNVLSATLEPGHAASHRAYKPTEEQILASLDIIEHLLKGEYIFPEVSKLLIEDVPKRDMR